MIRNWWRRFLAFFRLDKRLVCELSRDCGYVDYHDYPDSLDGQPWHFALHTCKGCGKEFTI